MLRLRLRPATWCDLHSRVQKSEDVVVDAVLLSEVEVEAVPVDLVE